MKAFLSTLRPAIATTVILLVILCGLYPLALWGIGQLFFAEKANGSLLVDSDGTVRGSRLIAQPFTAAQYFHPRPSVAGENGYDAASSGGSNLGPTSRKLAEEVQARIAAYRKTNQLSPEEAVPADAVTASASGLDPHISVRNAELQAFRVAKARSLTRGQIEAIIKEHTQQKDWGILGEAAVNVVELNRALDAL